MTWEIPSEKNTIQLMQVESDVLHASHRNLILQRGCAYIKVGGGGAVKS